MPRRTAQSKLAKKAAVALAQKYLDRHQRGDFRLVARSDQMEWVNGYWYIQVDPVPQSANTSKFIQQMVAATMELQDTEGEGIELTSMLPRDVASAEMFMPRVAQALSGNGQRARNWKSA